MVVVVPLMDFYWIDPSGYNMFVPMMDLCWVVNLYVDKRLELW